MTGASRAPGGETIEFSFDGTSYRARTGDTLAAALLANGIGLVGRSFKYHRPRGIMTAGVEEPNALVTVGVDGRTEPNTRATDVFVYEGLVAKSQNCWPNISFDAGAILGLAAPILPAGFYYKTFFGPPKRWMLYEYFIRRAAGLGKAPVHSDPDRYSQRAAFCEVLIVGGGPAGLSAAVSAAEAGQKVILVEQDRIICASLIRDPQAMDLQWVDEMVARVRAAGGCVLTRTTASGYWDHNLITLTQRIVEPGQTPEDGVAQRLWHVRAGEVILAPGSIERPLAFTNNDRPGIMLSQAVRSYVRRFGVRLGKRAVIATNNNDAYHTATALAEAGTEVVAILDARPAPAGSRYGAMFPVHNDAVLIQADGSRHHLSSVKARVGKSTVRWDADLLAVSGGFTPVVHLHMQSGGAVAWHETAQAFVPGTATQKVTTVGGAANPDPVFPVKSLGDPKKSFVDFQNDVSLADIDLAWAEGYRSVEHLKRYTTLGMATDQGKTSNMAALGRLAEKQGVTVAEAGLTTFRPPYTPVTMGVLAGAGAKDADAPVRRLPLHAIHTGQEAIWQPVGHWMRPRAYPRTGETLNSAAMREAKTVRSKVGLTDVSTLAKFEIKGPDAARLLEIVCATKISKLETGRGRYTFMLREDGLVFDDGTVWRLGPDRYLLTSSTGGADRMATVLSYVRHYLHPELRVSVTAVQDHYASLAIAGPLAVSVLQSVMDGDCPRHMSAVDGAIDGVPVLVLAASYSGERAFEIYADSGQIALVWASLKRHVEAVGGCLYGLQAMDFLRIEKGHLVVGGEIDGRRTPHDLLLDKMLNKAGGFMGAAGLARPAFSATGRKQLVGMEALEGAIPEGAMLVAQIGAKAEGHVTASGWRIVEGGSIALGVVANGGTRHGEFMVATSPTRRQHVRVRLSAPHFYDPAGTRYRE